MIDAPKKRQWLQFCLEINQVTSKIGNNKQTNLSTTIMETVQKWFFNLLGPPSMDLEVPESGQETLILAVR